MKGETIYVNTSLKRKPLEQSIKSDLMLEMEELENKYAQLKREQMGDTDDPKEIEKREQELLKKKLTKEELVAKRRELAYLKMRESQKSAKARQQNKIKSKKYHKLMKKQKMQEQIKEFELLQKTNPEAALEKLNALEKSRVLERASLRHKNTGTWAKSLQIRAKYDKDVRKDLSEQLQISRQLTQKVNDSDEDTDNENKGTNNGNTMEDEDMDYDPFNPWTKVGKNSNKLATKEEEEKANWRKYWLERNDNEKMMEEYKKLLNEDEEAEEDKEKNNSQLDEVNEERENVEEKTTTKKTKTTKNKKLLKKKVTVENGWKVEELEPIYTKSIDDIFDAQEDKIKENLSKKLDIIKQKAKQLRNNSKKPTKRLEKSADALKNLKDLSFKNIIKRPEIDEELTNELDEKDEEKNDLNKTLEKANRMEVGENEKTSVNEPLAETIDPNKLAAVKLKQRKSGYDTISEGLEDVDMDEELDANDEQQMTIAQAFEDDDIVADFSKDKSKDSEVKDAEIQLAMPGWGSWAGAGISKERLEKRNKRLLLNLAPKEKRRDDNKEGVFINEEASKQLRTHLVSDLPFPFTSLKDYEASIRAPIGRNTVTETAFRLLTRPSVITQKGKIIEPMDESELVKPQRKLRNPVDIRIANMSKDKPKKKV